jgi:Family of unknown function (DUF5317)
MFVLYAVPVGLLVGLLLGGRVAGLARLEFQLAPLIAMGMVIQVALFAAPIASEVGQAGPPIYIGSSLLVLAAVIRNAHLPGLPIVAVGAISNLAAIVANGGYMPASAEAMAAQGRVGPTVYSNSAAITQPVLAPLTDIFAMPVWMPAANVFSIGDVLIGVGVAMAIAVTMRQARVERSDEPRVAASRPLPVRPAGGASRN